MPLGNDLEQRVRSRLAELEANGLLRVLVPPSGVDLSSNDYLQLARHPSLVARLIEAVEREGCGSTASRLLRGERDCFSAVERRFARFKGTERALYFGSGYLANVAVLSTLPDSGDVIFSDDRNHASLIDGSRLSKARTVVFPHNDVGALQRLLAESGPDGVRFVVVESLFSMDGDVAPLAEYADLCASTGALLVVDEAHAVGVYGARGSGLLEESGVSRDACLSINTAGKALGVAGAFVAGPAWAIEYLVQRARPFIYSTAPPPALADALDESMNLVSSEPERRLRLHALSRHARSRLRAAGVDVAEGRSQIVPVVIGGNDAAVAVAAALQQAGFDVRAIRPPSVSPGTARLRVSINVGVSDKVLDQFVDRLSLALREIGFCSAASS
jgi:8-amino-7-oxononanoate synthase